MRGGGSIAPPLAVFCVFRKLLQVDQVPLRSTIFRKAFLRAPHKIYYNQMQTDFKNSDVWPFSARLSRAPIFLLEKSGCYRLLVRTSPVGTTAEIRSGHGSFSGGDEDADVGGLAIMARGRHRFRLVEDLGWRWVCAPLGGWGRVAPGSIKGVSQAERRVERSMKMSFDENSPCRQAPKEWARLRLFLYCALRLARGAAGAAKKKKQPHQ